MVRRRHVFYLHGYDPQGAPGYYQLFRRELSRFLKVWPLDVSLSDPQIDDDGIAARWHVKAAGPNWCVETTYEFLRWDDIVARDMRRPTAVVIPRILYWLIAYLLNGTTWRVFRANWRFALHYLVPTIAVVLMVPAAILIGWLTYRLAHGAMGAGNAIAAGAAIAAGGVFWAVSQRYVHKAYMIQICHAMLWFGGWAHGRRPESRARIDEFARRIIAKARAGGVDELLVIGHSVGGAIAVPVIARALEFDGDFASAGTPVTVATLGSLLPLAALHPLGRDTREAIRRLAVEPSLAWLDCQSRKDIMNFYECDMVEGMGVDAGPRQCNPLYWHVRFREVVSPEFYNYLRWNFFRMHFQFIMAGDRQAPYDYFMFVCGPIRLLDWAKNPHKTLACLGQGASYAPDAGDATACQAAIIAG